MMKSHTFSVMPQYILPLRHIPLNYDIIFDSKTI